VSQGRLIGVELPPAPAKRGAAPSPDLDPADRAALERWTRELEAYFRGERLAWTAQEIGLDALAAGSFERAVYEALVEGPPATTVSYGMLAEMAGHSRAARAVGTAMATNPIPVVVPCHRVIRSDGSLGRYGDDPAWKERLLEHERRHATRGPGRG
jgi:methylated-DNA-[protein]-cysteine S-methyltransferase